MIINDEDIKILVEFAQLCKDELHLSDLVKNICKNVGSKELNKTRYRIERMSEVGLFHIDGKPKNYCLIKDNVYYGDIKFPDKKIKKSLGIRVDGKWQIIEL